MRTSSSPTSSTSRTSPLPTASSCRAPLSTRTPPGASPIASPAACRAGSPSRRWASPARTSTPPPPSTAAALCTSACAGRSRIPSSSPCGPTAPARAPRPPCSWNGAGTHPAPPRSCGPSRPTTWRSWRPSTGPAPMPPGTRCWRATPASSRRCPRGEAREARRRRRLPRRRPLRRAGLPPRRRHGRPGAPLVRPGAGARALALQGHHPPPHRRRPRPRLVHHQPGEPAASGGARARGPCCRGPGRRDALGRHLAHQRPFQLPRSHFRHGGTGRGGRALCRRARHRVHLRAHPRPHPPPPRGDRRRRSRGPHLSTPLRLRDPGGDGAAAGVGPLGLVRTRQPGRGASRRGAPLDRRRRHPAAASPGGRRMSRVAPALLFFSTWIFPVVSLPLHDPRVAATWTGATATALLVGGATAFGGWWHDVHAIRAGKIVLAGSEGDPRGAEVALASFAPPCYFAIGATYTAAVLLAWHHLGEGIAAFAGAFLGALALLCLVPSVVFLTLDPSARRALKTLILKGG